MGCESVTTFYFVRHGKTENNAKGLFNGGTVDSPLIPSGVEATKRMGQHLKTLPFDLALTSPQMRAQTTAKLILDENQYPTKLEIVEDLREMRLGDWDGKKVDKITEDYPEDIKNYRTRPDLFDAKKFHAESYAELIARSTKVIKKVSDMYPDGKILIVSHGILLMALLNTLKGSPLAETRDGGIMDNSSLTILNYVNGEVHIEDWGKSF